MHDHRDESPEWTAPEPAYSWERDAPALEPPRDVPAPAESSADTTSSDTAWPEADPDAAPAELAPAEPDVAPAGLTPVAPSPAWYPAGEPTVELAPRRPLDPSVNVDEIDHQYGQVRRGPLHRFALWASGADQVVLDHARVEEAEHVVQGTLVAFTATVAAIAGMAAGSFLLYGRFAVTAVSVVIGLVWGAGIFVLDRALVSSTYNPYRFSRSEVESLTELHAAAPWEHVLARLRMSHRAQRTRDMLRVLSFGTALRIALAIATSYIVAEMALFLIFEPEVNLRTQYLQNLERTQQVSEINSRYQKSSVDDATRRVLLTGDNDPEVIRLTGELSNLDKRLDDARHDFGVLSAAAAAELNGDPYRGTLSDGTPVETTGRPGDGAAAKSLADRRDNQRAIVDDLALRQASTRDALTRARDAFKLANADAIAELDRKTSSETQQRNTEIAQVTNEPPLKGLLRRQAALDLLTYDTNPATLQNDPIPPCTGLFAGLCKLRNWFWPPTPMGPTVIALRTIFLVIELMPISFKILQSIRPRRPYDVAKAALEHASMLRSYRMLDAALHDVSLDMVGQSAKARHAYQQYGRTPRARRSKDDEPDADDTDADAEDRAAASRGRPRPDRPAAPPQGLRPPAPVPVAETPVFVGDVATMNVVIVGGQGVGKTALLAMLYDQLQLTGSRGYSLHCADPVQVAELKANALRVRAPRDKWPDKSTLRLEQYTFRCILNFQNQSSDLLHIRYWDYSGDVIDDPASAKAAPRVVQQLDDIARDAHVFLLAVDGELLHKALRGRAGGVKAARNPAPSWGGTSALQVAFEPESDAEAVVEPGFGSQNEEDSAALRKLEDSLGYLTQKTISGRNVPVHIVITKWDQLRDNGCNLGQVRDLLLGSNQIRDLLERCDRPVRLIPVSAVGYGTVHVAPTPTGGSTMVKNADKQLSPINLEVLFATVLPDWFDSIFEDRSPGRLRQRVALARRQKNKSVWARVLNAVTRQLFRIRGVNVPGVPVGLVMSDMDPHESLFLANLSAWIKANAHAAKEYEDLTARLEQLERSAEWAVRAHFAVVSAMRRRMTAFEGSFEESFLSKGRSGDGRP